MWYGYYRDWWGQEFRCINWHQQINRRCQWFLGHGLRHCSCEFSRTFKRRDCWQGDQDMEDSHLPFPKDKNPLDKWRRSAVYLFPWFGVLVKRVLTILATLATSERLFSTAGNVMTKQHSSLACDNMKELVYLHEVWSQVRDWEAVKKMRLEWFFFWINDTHYLQWLLLSLVLWLWDSIWIIATSTLPRCFSSPFSLSIHTHTHTHLVTIIVYWYWQN